MVKKDSKKAIISGHWQIYIKKIVKPAHVVTSIKQSPIFKDPTTI
jgi:hypothetical protein